MVLTDVGKNMIRDFLSGDSIDYPTHMALGDDSTTPTTGDTTLGNELLRVAFDSTSKIASKKLQWEMILETGEGNGGGTETYDEVGILNASSGGDLFDHIVYDTLTKNDTIEIRFQIVLEVK